MRTLAKRLCLLSLSGLDDILDNPGTIVWGIMMNTSAGFWTKLINIWLFIESKSHHSIRKNQRIIQKKNVNWA